jgi:dCMP deaminase
VNWNEYFFKFAEVAALKSKDPRRQVGCVIVDSNNRIISTGFNGFPKKCN